ncbi:MAG: hypothetical protein LC118_07860 [Dehalococcoidia bacterium]|nr:hypothetical protein [Dehalococcoidia bacterium]
MTAKQALREWIDRMSNEEAEELLAQLECDATDDELTPEDLIAIGRSEEEYARGDYVDGEELFRELGL